MCGSRDHLKSIPSHQNCTKAIPFAVAHTYIAHIRTYPPWERSSQILILVHYLEGMPLVQPKILLQSLC